MPCVCLCHGNRFGWEPKGETLGSCLALQLRLKKTSTRRQRQPHSPGQPGEEETCSQALCPGERAEPRPSSSPCGMGMDSSALDKPRDGAVGSSFPQCRRPVPVPLLLTQFLCRCRARLPVSSVTRASQMWVFCFSPICSTGESCEKSSLPAVLMCQEKGARSPGCASKALRGMVGSSTAASSASQQLSHVVGTKATSGPVLDTLPCPSAAMMFLLCYPISPTASTAKLLSCPAPLHACWEPLTLS